MNFVAKKEIMRMSKKIRTEAVDYLFEAIFKPGKIKKSVIHFEDICTINELLSLSQRFEVAKKCCESREPIWILPRRRELPPRQSAA